MPDWLNILLRSAGLLIVVFLITRAFGKKHPSKVNPFRFVNYTVIALIATLVILDLVPNPGAGMIALTIWFLFPLAGEYLAMRSKSVHDLLYGRETVLVRQGKIMEENLKSARLTGEELLGELRTRNVFNLADVEFAVLETDGNVNVLLKAEKAPVTPHDLEWKVAPRAEPQTVIMDGNILNEQLTALGLNRHWLKEKLESSGILLDNVFIGQVDASGDLYVDLFDDSLEAPRPKVKELLYAGLEKAQSELSRFALETANQEARQLYGSHAGRLRELLDRLRPYLLR